MVILRILEWHLEDLALADVMNSHAAFPFYVVESEGKSETLF